MLVFMAITHLPTWFSAHVGQPLGFVSAAEGFVFLSAYLVGSVYARMATTRGMAAMRHALWDRAVKVYAVHAGLLLFLFWCLVPIAEMRGAEAITNLASFYREDPQTALAAGLLLLYNPPLLDILPMYVVFLLASPILIGWGSRRGWSALFATSIILWMFAQFHGGRVVYEAIASLVDMRLPYEQTGAFALLAWQLLWLVGLYFGVRSVDEGANKHEGILWARPLWWTAVVMALVLLVWRHAVGQVPFGDNAALNALFDKWFLGPLRLFNFALLAIIIMHCRPALGAWARNSTIAMLGRASLTVFSAHLVLCLSLLMSAGISAPTKPVLLDAALLAGCLITLYALAQISLNSSKATVGDAKQNPARDGNLGSTSLTS